ncbi:MAG: hypothetical protein QOE36_1475 [Gaiellaceae bacterium]|jgi:hypothetical protein|nr:hypothetical protein [Gaiellaceae bacterium]
MRNGRRWLLTTTLLLALNAAFWLAHAGFAASPISLIAQYFGPKMVRAEIVWKDGGATHDTRIDRGKVRAVTSTSVTLLEKDGTLVTVPVSPAATVRMNSRVVPLTKLHRGLTVTVIRSDDAPASTVQAGQ